MTRLYLDAMIADVTAQIEEAKRLDRPGLARELVSARGHLRIARPYLLAADKLRPPPPPSRSR